jgi:hypothetical protein
MPPKPVNPNRSHCLNKYHVQKVYLQTKSHKKKGTLTRNHIMPPEQVGDPCSSKQSIVGKASFAGGIDRRSVFLIQAYYSVIATILCMKILATQV